MAGPATAESRSEHDVYLRAARQRFTEQVFALDKLLPGWDISTGRYGEYREGAPVKEASLLVTTSTMSLRVDTRLIFLTPKVIAHYRVSVSLNGFGTPGQFGLLLTKMRQALDVLEQVGIVEGRRVV